MAERRVMKIERLSSGPDHGGQTLRHFVQRGARSRPWKWFEPGEVPKYEGSHAWFECERAPGGWKVLRQVPKPAWER